MRVKRIRLTGFRNHTESSLEFGDGINFITGANAQGKTSILEALSYACLTKSFLSIVDSTVPKFGGESFTVDAEVESDRNLLHHVRVAYEAASGKRYFLDKNEVARSMDVIGMFPIVVLSPGDFVVTGGPPAERRKLLDMVLSQVSHSYLEELMEYRRVLRQRNKILLDGKLNGMLDGDSLRAWTDALIIHGTKVMTKRADFVREFESPFSSAYASLVEYGELPRVVYGPSFDPGNDTMGSFEAAVATLRNAERMRGATLVGPHRDNVGFILNDKPIQEFASQGQHKTFLVALRVAEFYYMKNKLGETPVMLLDDVMTELDYSRATKALVALSGLGQSFVTATDMLNIDEKLLDTREMKIHTVREGNIVYENV